VLLVVWISGAYVLHPQAAHAERTSLSGLLELLCGAGVSFDACKATLTPQDVVSLVEFLCGGDVHNCQRAGSASLWQLVADGSGDIFYDNGTVTIGGHVGIGTTSPDTTNNSVHITNVTGEPHDAGITLERIGQAKVQLRAGNLSEGLIFRTLTDSPFLFLNVDSEKFRIAANGNISGTFGLYHAASDRRLKKDIVTITNALHKVLSLHGVNYRWQDGGEADAIQMGLIAQEVEQVIPEVVHTAEDEMGTKSIRHENLVALLIEAIKELKADKDAQIAALEARLVALEQAVGKGGTLAPLSSFSLPADWPLVGGLVLVGLVLGRRWRKQGA